MTLRIRRELVRGTFVRSGALTVLTLRRSSLYSTPFYLPNSTVLSFNNSSAIPRITLALSVKILSPSAALSRLLPYGHGARDVGRRASPTEGRPALHGPGVGARAGDREFELGASGRFAREANRPRSTKQHVHHVSIGSNFECHKRSRPEPGFQRIAYL